MFSNILIIKLGALGDIVRMSFLINEYKRMNPSTRIHWLINENAKALLRYNPNISVVLCPGDYEKTIKDIKFDVVYSFDEDIDLELLSSLQYINIVGLSSDNNQLEYCERSKNWFDMSLVSKH